MPANQRVRGNNVFGVTTDNPLTAGASSFNSLGLANLPVVIVQHATITLDPLRQFGNPEIVIVTVHTVSSIVATITRGAYGTTARAHPLGTLWVHAPLDEDFIEIVTSITRPIDPYEGQFIFETDTNKLVGYGGVDWAPRDAGGQLGYAQVVANQGSITTLTDLTSLTATVTVGTGRSIKITGSIQLESSVGSDQFDLLIREGGVTLKLAQQTLSATANRAALYNTSVVLTPGAGAHTYKLSLDRSFGSGTAIMVATANRICFILVEDIGAA